jgi:hypothetical protein
MIEKIPRFVKVTTSAKWALARRVGEQPAKIERSPMKPNLRRSPWVPLALLFFSSQVSMLMAQGMGATWGPSTGEAAAMPPGLRLGATSAPYYALIKNPKLSSHLVTLAAAEQRVQWSSSAPRSRRQI